MTVDNLLQKLKSEIKQTKKNIEYLLYDIQKEYETINKLKTKIEEQNPLIDFKHAWEYKNLGSRSIELQNAYFENAHKNIDIYIAQLPELQKRHHVISLLYIELYQQLFLLQSHGFYFVDYKCAEYHKYTTEDLKHILKNYFKEIKRLKKSLEEDESWKKETMEERRKQIIAYYKGKVEVAEPEK